MEQQYRPVRVRQRGHIPLHAVAHLSPLHHSQRRFRVLVLDLKIFGMLLVISGLHPAATTQAVETDMCRDLIQPTQECTVVFERRALPESTQEGFLGEIVRFRAVPDHLADVPSYCRPGPFEYICWTIGAAGRHHTR